MKTSKGRQKIVMKKIEKITSLQVTFSKRRRGLFNQAAKLSILTGADVAVLVKSSGDKVFSFGNPSPDYVIDRFLSHNQKLDDVAAAYKQTECVSTGDAPFWWEEDASGLGLAELEVYVAALEELQSKVLARANDLGAVEKFHMANETTDTWWNSLEDIVATEDLIC